jgi:hypothetical protein
MRCQLAEAALANSNNCRLTHGVDEGAADRGEGVRGRDLQESLSPHKCSKVQQRVAALCFPQLIAINYTINEAQQLQQGSNRARFPEALVAAIAAGSFNFLNLSGERSARTLQSSESCAK